MCHVLCKKHPFPKVVQLLSLGSWQIQDFLTMYLAEHRVWEAYEANVSKIPHHKLMVDAVESSCCVSDLINLYRPPLSTDRITRKDVHQATEYMKHQGLDRYAEDLEDWIGINTQGFVDLGITEPILLHVKDKHGPRGAQYSGWIDVEQIKVVAMARAEQMAAEADNRCLINDVFLGAAPQVIPRSTPGASQDKIVRDGIHVTPRRNRFVRSGILRDMTNLVPIGRLESSSLSANRQLTAHDSQLNTPTSLDIHEPQISQAQRSTALAAIQRSRNLHMAMDNSQCAHPALGDTRAANVNLRRQIASIQALKSLINPSGAVQREKNGLFGTAAGSEISAVVSGGLSAGYHQSLSNRLETPSKTAEHCDSTAIEAIQLPEAVEDAPGADDAGKSPEIQRETEAVSSPVAKLNTISAQLRQELDKRWKHYLGEENKAPVGRPRTHCSAPTEAADDDSDYTPEKSPRHKRKQPVQIQKTPVKHRKLGTTPNTPWRSQFRDVPVESPDEAIKALNFISIDHHQQASQQGGKTPPTNAPHSPGSMVAISPCPHPSSKASGVGIARESHKPKKNTAPIFGLQRNQELARPVDLAENAEYAWSAERAEFADISQVARYALKANRLTGADLLKGASGWPKDALTALTKLKGEFDAVEFQQRGSATRNAERSKLAGCADWALYAGEAREADFALEVSGERANAAWI